MLSQNLRFLGPVAADPANRDPPGLPIVQLLSAELPPRGWIAHPWDIWRDSGWLLPCRTGERELDLTLASIGPEDEWMLQIAPTRLPGLLGRALGRLPSATPMDCNRLALDVHAVLAGAGGFTRFWWRWDGFPDEASSTPEPMPPSPPA
jgi:hypothetical protein